MRTHLSASDLVDAGIEFLEAAEDQIVRDGLLRLREPGAGHFAIGWEADKALRLLRAGISANPLDRVQVGPMTPDDTVEIDLSTSEGVKIVRVTGRQILDFVMGAQEVKA